MDTSRVDTIRDCYSCPIHALSQSELKQLREYIDENLAKAGTGPSPAPSIPTPFPKTPCSPNRQVLPSADAQNCERRMPKKKKKA